MGKIKWLHIIKAFNIALAAVMSIAAAELLGLEYAVTAGIITVLTMQNTKRETLKTARNRAAAFMFALLLAYMCYSFIGFSAGAFIVYLFLFAFLCLSMGWVEAIAMDSVLISHFLAWQKFDMQAVLNEILLFAIGTCFGILINLRLRKREGEFDMLSRNVDDEIKGIIHRMSDNMKRGDEAGYNAECFAGLEGRIRAAKECALRNWNNTLRDPSPYELDYIRMRENQSRVLMNIYKGIAMINTLPVQTISVAGFIDEIEAQYHRDNDVSGLLQELEQMFLNMRQEKLPESREEFEARAVLFYTLKQLDEFLRLKNQFVMNCRKDYTHGK